MDERPFRTLRGGPYDLCVYFDYRNLEAALRESTCGEDVSSETVRRANLETLVQYDSIAIVAWSFGCAVAAHFMEAMDWPVSDALAINGTVVPEHEEWGIPAQWLDATAETLLQGGWPKFVRRMCPDKVGRHHFQKHVPQRDLTGALSELEVLRGLLPPRTSRFRRAIVGLKDRIIRPENQTRCWQEFDVPTQTLDAPHYPFHLWPSWDDVLELGAPA